MDRQQIIKLIVASEKGVNRNEPESVGGLSIDGISVVKYAEVLAEVRKFIPDAPGSVEEIVDRPDVVNKVYEINLGKAHVWELPECLQYMYADFYTNGQAAAVRIIQRIVSVEDDGIWGSGTSQAVVVWRKRFEEHLAEDPDADNELIMRFHEEKLAHYQRLVDKKPEVYEKWHKGWIRRANHILSLLSEYFIVDEPSFSAVDEEDVIVEDTSPDPVTDIAESLRESELQKYTHDQLLAEIKRRMETEIG